MSFSGIDNPYNHANGYGSSGLSNEIKNSLGANKIGYSIKTFGIVNKNQIKHEIIASSEYSKELNAEIRATLHRANLRIQALENAKITSPAYEALGELTEKSNFSKFSVAGKSWEQRKLEYGKAIAFMRKPTSTITGAKEYRTYIMDTYDIDEREFNDLVGMMHKSDSYSAFNTGEVLAKHYEDYLYHYKDFTGELETTAKSLADDIEAEARDTVNQINAELERQAEAIANEIVATQKAITDKLKDLGEKLL